MRIFKIWTKFVVMNNYFNIVVADSEEEAIQMVKDVIDDRNEITKVEECTDKGIIYNDHGYFN